MKARAVVLDFEGSPEELARLVGQRDAGGIRLMRDGPLPEVSRAAVNRVTGDTFPWTKELVERLWEVTCRKPHRRQQRRVIEALVNHDGKLAHKELLRETQIKANALKGVLSSITRNAQRISQYKGARLIEQGEEGEYFVPEGPLHVLQEVIGTVR